MFATDCALQNSIHVLLHIRHIRDVSECGSMVTIAEVQLHMQRLTNDSETSM